MLREEGGLGHQVLTGPLGITLDQARAALCQHPDTLSATPIDVPPQ